MGKLVLYSYFRSSCSWRVRLALHLKQLDYEYRPIHLVKDGGEQYQQEYLRVNPLGQVPALVHDNVTITQSVAIMEYLEEKFPQIPLLPRDPVKRARVREIVEMINSGTQPIQNLSVLRKLSDDPEVQKKWSAFWIEKGLRGVEKVLSTTAGKFCVGDSISLADCCLIPQVFNAERFQVDISDMTNIKRIMENVMATEAFKKASPKMQPDCPPELK